MILSMVVDGESTTDALTQAGVWAVALMAMIGLFTLAFKKLNSFGNWVGDKFHIAMTRSVGRAVREQLEYKNGGTGFGDKMEGFENGQVEITKNIKCLDTRMGKMETRQDTVIEFIRPAAPAPEDDAA